jgi:hypothetical protein
MEFHNLSNKELKALFLNINARYLKIIDTPIRSYIDSPEFLSVRNQLHEVVNELEKRRNQDPFIIHPLSPRGLEPDTN